MKRLILLLWLVLPFAATAQSYPDYSSITVNDFAGILNDADEKQINTKLTKLRSDTGVEMVVVTLASLSDYSEGRSLEAYATGLFNYWGVGNADRNDGILILVVPDDRVMRIELGKAFAQDWDRTAMRIVDDSFLPPFRDGDYPAGILTGTQAVIDDIALPYSQNIEPEAEPILGPQGIFYVVMGVIALLGLSPALLRLRRRYRKCPQCGHRSWDVEKHELVAPTKRSSGKGERVYSCKHCSYVHVMPFSIAATGAMSSGGSFGGGSSGGGGASGSW